MENDNLYLNLSSLKSCTPAWFAQNVSQGKWKLHPHLSLIDGILLKSIQGEYKRIIVNMPPRHGKSEFISGYFPAWYLGKFPDKKIILTSYNSRFAAVWGRKVRELIRNFGKEYFDVGIDDSCKAASGFRIAEHDGEMFCTGAGGTITGKGADLIIIDDPVKNDSQAHSPVISDNIWEWFKSTLYTRLEPNGIIIIIMTRWHDNDLCGRLLATSNFSIPGNGLISSEYNDDCVKDNKKMENLEDGISDLDYENEKWLYICLPAIADINDPLGRKPGEALWEKRFSIRKLNSIRRNIGSYWFSALYQQKPNPAGGGIFKRQYFKYFSADNEFYYIKSDGKSHSSQSIFRIADCPVYASMDLATKASETSDYTVILIFAINDNRDIFVLDIIRERFDGADHIKLLHSVFERWHPILIGIESAQYQLTLVQTAQRKGMPVIPLKATKDKVSRSLPIAARLEAGSVYFREGAHWLDSFEDELLAFPKGTHDDQVDAFAYIAEIIQPITNAMPVAATGGKFLKDRLTLQF
ncbi:MAG: hypothetical protein HW421_1430 [Ignavibacteria bacterium]|nr:hypothetical protein [Ignavibacteria bacterium]